MGDETELIRLAREVNDSVPGKLVDKAVEALGEAGREVGGANVLVLGLSFRGGVKEVIKSPAVDVISLLKDVGANVFCFDPLFSRQEIEAYGVGYRDDYEGIDCVIIAADHVEFKDLDWGEIGGVMRAKVVVDSRQIVDPCYLRGLGFVCYSLGFV
ncbi:MAG: hypothetical protein KAU03_03485 [Candidatus Altiarchaeales archaeon]|nr:hypothetical protein [Candidatus Altiarchaeales archaeon]